MIFRTNTLELGRAERTQRAWSGTRLADAYRLPAPPRVETPLSRALAGLKRQAAVMVGLVAVATLIALLTALIIVPTGRTVVQPGHLAPAYTIMKVDGQTPAGSTAQAVVVDRRGATALDLLRKRLGGDLRIETPDQPTDRVIQDLGDQVLRASFAQARYAALAELGVPARFTASRVIVTALTPNSPFAKAGIRTGDAIVQVNSKPVSSALDLTRRVEAAPRTPPVAITLASGRTIRVPLPPRTELPHIRQVELKQTLGMMVLSIDAQVHAAPHFAATFQPSFEGGSAGLAVGAASVQMTGIGTKAPPYAATGSLYADGSVGPVDDVTPKATGVAQSGVHYFLVPRDNLSDARAAHARGLHVVPIDSLDDVSRWLARWDRSVSYPKGH